MPDPSVPVVKKDINRYAKAGAVMCMNQHRECIENLEKGSVIIGKDDLHQLDLSPVKGGLGIIAVGINNILAGQRGESL